MKTIKLTALVFSAAISISLNVQAKDCDPDMPSLLNFACKKGWALPLGAGVEYGGKADASKNYETGVEPVAMLHFSTESTQIFIEGVENGIRYFASDDFLFSLAGRYEYGRKESDDPEFLKGLGDIKDKWMGVVEARYALIGDYDVWIGGRSMVGDKDLGELHIAVVGLGVPRLSKKVDFELLLWSTWANSAFLNRDFGVTAAQSVASGYEEYSAKSGHRALGAGLFTRIDFSDNWKALSEINYESYNSRLDKSPIIKKGRNSEYEANLSFVYIF
ncbi:MAG: MipA/OmpV family protein [Proteobacteria bacterium]|jgi:outer membrane scaffolding protein for murein synthesis (MipA/OmpV family)|nr:MipA/OmpV family protein [Pseudomonadota bacterium]